jgi:hypothetical protein
MDTFSYLFLPSCHAIWHTVGYLNVILFITWLENVVKFQTAAIGRNGRRHVVPSSHRLFLYIYIAYIHLNPRA